MYTEPYCRKCILYHTAKSVYYTILPKVYTIPYCQKCILYHTAKSVYCTILPKVYTVPYCRKFILYHTAKSVYYTILPKVYTIPYCQKFILYNTAKSSRTDPAEANNMLESKKKVRTKSQIQAFEDILISRPFKHSSLFWYRQHRFHSRLQH